MLIQIQPCLFASSYRAWVKVPTLGVGHSLRRYTYGTFDRDLDARLDIDQRQAA